MGVRARSCRGSGVVADAVGTNRAAARSVLGRALLLQAAASVGSARRPNDAWVSATARLIEDGRKELEAARACLPSPNSRDATDIEAALLDLDSGILTRVSLTPPG